MASICEAIGPTPATSAPGLAACVQVVAVHGGGALVFAAGVKSLAGDLADKAFAARVMAEHGPFQYARPVRGRPTRTVRHAYRITTAFAARVQSV